MIRKFYDLKKSIFGGMGFLCMSLIVSFLLLPSCTKPPVEPVDPCEINPCDTSKLMGKLDTIWTASVRSDNLLGGNNGMLYFNNMVINNYIGSIDYGLGTHSNQDGKQLSSWNESETDHFSNLILNESESNVILQRNGLIVKVDPLTGSTLKEYRFSQDLSSHTYGQLLGGYFYCTRRNEEGTKAWLLRSPVSDLENWETVYELNRGTDTGGSRPNIQSYNLWVNPETGDSILIFQHRMALPNRVDVVAWNLNQKRVEWKYENLTKDGNSSHQQIFILRDKAYFAGSLTFYCFDLLTGDIIWEYDHPEQITGFTIFKIIYADQEDAIIFKDGAGLFAFDPQTGAVKWHNKQAGDSAIGSGSPVYYNGIIYYTTFPRLTAARATDGKILWSEKSTLGNFVGFNGEIAIDPEKKFLFVSDKYYLMAIKLYNN